MKNSLIILTFFSVGLFLGVFDYLPNIITENDYSMYALYGLMFLVGISIGADRESWKIVRQMNLKILLVPLGISCWHIGRFCFGWGIGSGTEYKRIYGCGSRFWILQSVQHFYFTDKWRNPWNNCAFVEYTSRNIYASFYASFGFIFRKVGRHCLRRRYSYGYYFARDC